MTRIYYFECDDCGYGCDHRIKRCPECGSKNIIDMSREMLDDD